MERSPDMGGFDPSAVEVTPEVTTEGNVEVSADSVASSSGKGPSDSRHANGHLRRLHDRFNKFKDLK